MKLRFSPASPYVRKVSVTLIETGLEDRVEKVVTDVWDPETDIAGDNPLGKVPTLILDDGQVLYDSPVVCEYLDSLHDGEKLFPASGPARWKALQLQALGDGMTDAGIASLLEGRRPEEFRYEKWIARQTAVVFRAMDAMENDLKSLQSGFGIGQIAIACSLGWLDFRFPDLGWREDRPGLADWYVGASERPSLSKTIPAAP
ncbi:MAG: glutathione S-transferase [Alphaproteobacteria bacterium]|jgi:glutathione S-transferase|nr:glutathione S-transferase [Alphaproteobacteria bacterium]MBT7942430.1 glutathione S-transferase [Alphaproteobacteria bacterium]